EDEPLRRQTDLCPGRVARREGALPVIHLIAFGQMHDLLSIIRLLVQWQNHGVCDDVIDEVASQGSGKSKIAYLDGRGSEGKNSRACVLGMTLEINGDVDPKIVEKPCDVLVAPSPDVEELVECGLESRSHFAAIIGTERHSDHVELRPIVQLEQFRREIGHRMSTKIGGNIGELDLVVAPDSTVP